MTGDAGGFATGDAPIAGADGDRAPETATPRGTGTIVLVGVPGAGVSITAVAVGEALGIEVRDTDELVAERLGAPVHELVVDLGEDEYRAAESAVVTEVLATDPLARPAVVGLGSGALGAVADRLAELRAEGVPVVHLRLTPGTAMRRLGLSGLGSVALPNPRAMWTTMAAERDAALEAVASTTIDTTAMDPDEVRDAVLEVVRAG
ncbi:shikimate kinase [Georgenia sp. Z1491]|uniref:shikimate kinase n=1 Tax=Georgenia sp. Z1491 TaxID=3416707 RepID=UPI003CF59474